MNRDITESQSESGIGSLRDGELVDLGEPTSRIGINQPYIALSIEHRADIHLKTNLSDVRLKITRVSHRIRHCKVGRTAE